MSTLKSPSRRRLMQSLALGVPLAALATSRPERADAAAALLDAASPEAKAVKYVENAKDARAATAGSSCANCGLYQGVNGSARGPCQLFPGKDVKASGWCTSWAPQM